MPIESEGLDHDRSCPKCKGALDEAVGYDLCPHCGHRLSEKTSRTSQWQCPGCGEWDYEGIQPHGGTAWHDCKNCGYQEQHPTDMSRRFAPKDWNEDEQGQYDYDEWTDEAGNPLNEAGRSREHATGYPDEFPEDEVNPDDYPEDVPRDQLDYPWNAPHQSKFEVVAMGEMQQPGGVGATQTTGPTDGEGIQHPDDHSEMADAGKNSFEQNVALETWVNFAVDMLNRGKSEQEVSAQLAHDGCPEPRAVLQRAIEQPQQDPVGSEGAADPFETPTPEDPTSTMETVHQQPPVTAHWLEADKAEPGQQVRIAGTSWRGIELDRWEDLYGQKMAKVALSDGGIITVAAEVVEPDGQRKIQDPATEIQNFIDGLPEVEPTRPSVIARIANLKMARMAVKTNISKCGFTDQVKLERLDRTAGDEILELTDLLGRLASDSDRQYVQERQRYRIAGQRNRETVVNEEFNTRIAERAAIFVSELEPEHRADMEQTLYAAARFASANNGDVNAFIAAVKKAWGPNQRDPGEVDNGWPVRGGGDFPVDPKRDDWLDDDPSAPGRGAFDHLDPHQGPIPPVNDLYPDNDLSDEGGMNDEEYWAAREHGSHPDHNPEEDPFAIWPNGHPMDR